MARVGGPRLHQSPLKGALLCTLPGAFNPVYQTSRILSDLPSIAAYVQKKIVHEYVRRAEKDLSPRLHSAGHSR